MTLLNTFLLVNGLIGLAYGLYCFLFPDKLEEALGITAVSQAGNTELRASTGGTHAAVGILVLLALAYEPLVTPALITLITFTGGMGVARLLALCVNRDFSMGTTLLTLFEILVGICAFLLI